MWILHQLFFLYFPRKENTFQKVSSQQVIETIELNDIIMVFRRPENQPTQPFQSRFAYSMETG